MSWEARRTFCPFRPMASESWSSSTTAVITCRAVSDITFATRAGASARRAKTSGSGCQGTMSIRSPPNSDTTAWTREPLSPTQAPTGSMDSSWL